MGARERARERGSWVRERATFLHPPPINAHMFETPTPMSTSTTMTNAICCLLRLRRGMLQTRLDSPGLAATRLCREDFDGDFDCDCDCDFGYGVPRVQLPNMHDLAKTRAGGFWDRRFEKFFLLRKFMREMFKAKRESGVETLTVQRGEGVVGVFMCV